MDLRAVLVSCAFVVLSIANFSYAVTPAEIEKVGTACNATKEDIITLQQQKVPTTESGKCALLCILTRFYPVFDSDGKYDVKKTEEALLAAFSDKPAHQMNDVAKHCERILSSEPTSNYKTCQIAYDVTECILKRGWELGWFNGQKKDLDEKQNLKP